MRDPVETYMNLVPMVVETDQPRERLRHFLAPSGKSAFIFLTGSGRRRYVDARCSPVLFLRSYNPKKGISMYINSPGAW